MGLLRSVGISPVTADTLAGNIAGNPLAAKLRFLWDAENEMPFLTARAEMLRIRLERFFQDVTSSVTGFFNRSKKKVEEQVGNIDTDQLKEQAGRVGDALRNRAQEEVDGVRRDVDQPKRQLQSID